MTRIIVFGDSIAYGAWDIEGGWVARLRKFLDNKTMTDPKSYFIIDNVAISGDKTTELLNRFEFETKQRIVKEDENILIISIGINDSQIMNNKTRTSKIEFKENLSKIILIARKFTSKIILVGLTPVDEAKTVPIPWETSKSYKKDTVLEYDNIIKEVCNEARVPYIFLFNKFSKSDLYDGLHPNDKGHKKIFEAVKEFLIKKKWI